jgi:osmoprotectant transport system permease protein
VSGDFFAHVLAHIALCASALAAAIVLAIPLAGAIVDRPAARALALGLAGGLRVIPSLAILTLALPLLGLGFAPALLALVVLAVPPIVINAEVGLRTVPATILEAAAGSGMTTAQVGRRVRWPLALPVVAVGVRTAAVEVIASATLASFIGAGGLGDYIVDGLATNDLGELFLGAGSVAALALVVDRLLALAERRLSAAT